MRKLTKADALRVLEVVDAGLVSGLGVAKPGHMCVEAAICFALGQPHGDEPDCVSPVLRAYKIGINDGPWSSNNARTQGMRRAAVAQLGSLETDQVACARFLAEQTIRRILPISLRAVGLNAEADRCVAEGTESAAWSAESAASAASAESAAWSARSAAESAESAESAAAWSAESAESAAWSAESAAWSAKSAASDEILTIAADICVEACIKFGTEGSQWLDICGVR